VLEEGGSDRDKQMSFMESEALRLKDILDESLFVDDAELEACREATRRAQQETKEAREALKQAEKNAAKAAAEAAAKILGLESKVDEMGADAADMRSKSSQSMAHDKTIADAKLEAAEVKIKKAEAKLYAAAAEAKAHDETIKKLQVNVQDLQTQLETAIADGDQEREKALEADKARDEVVKAAAYREQQMEKKFTTDKATLASKAISDMKSAMEKAVREREAIKAQMKADFDAHLERKLSDALGDAESHFRADKEALEARLKLDMDTVVKNKTKATIAKCHSEKEDALKKAREEAAEALDLAKAECSVEISELKDEAKKALEAAIADVKAAVEAKAALDRIAAEARAAGNARSEAEARAKAERGALEAKLQSLHVKDKERMESAARETLVLAVEEKAEEGKKALQEAQGLAALMKERAIEEAKEELNRLYEEEKLVKEENERARLKAVKREEANALEEAGRIAVSLSGLELPQKITALRALQESQRVLVLAALPDMDRARVVLSYEATQKEEILKKLALDPRVGIEREFARIETQKLLRKAACEHLKYSHRLMRMGTVLKHITIDKWVTNAQHEGSMMRKTERASKYHHVLMKSGFSKLEKCIEKLSVLERNVCFTRMATYAAEYWKQKKEDDHIQAKQLAEALTPLDVQEQNAAMKVMPYKQMVLVVLHMEEAARADILMVMEEAVRSQILSDLPAEAREISERIMEAVKILEMEHAQGVRLLFHIFTSIRHRFQVELLRNWRKSMDSVLCVSSHEYELAKFKLKKRLGQSLIERVVGVFREVGRRKMGMCLGRLKAQVESPEARLAERREWARMMLIKMAEMSTGEKLATLTVMEQGEMVAILEEMSDEERADMLLAMDLTRREEIMDTFSTLARVGVEAVIFRLEYRAQQRRASANQMRILMDKNRFQRLSEQCCFVMMKRAFAMERLHDAHHDLHDLLEQRKRALELAWHRLSQSQRTALNVIGEHLIRIRYGAVGVLFHRMKVRCEDGRGSRDIDRAKAAADAAARKRNHEIARALSELSISEQLAALSMLENRNLVVAEMGDYHIAGLLGHLPQEERIEYLPQVPVSRICTIQHIWDSAAHMETLKLSSLKRLASAYGNRKAATRIQSWRGKTNMSSHTQLSQLLLSAPRLLDPKNVQTATSDRLNALETTYRADSPMRQRVSRYTPSSPVAIGTSLSLQKMTGEKRDAALLSMPSSERVATVATMVHQSMRVAGFRISNHILLRRKRKKISGCVDGWKWNMQETRLALLAAMDADNQEDRKRLAAAQVRRQWLMQEEMAKRRLIGVWKRNQARYNQKRQAISLEDSMFRRVVRILRVLMSRIEAVSLEAWRKNYRNALSRHGHAFNRVKSAIRRRMLRSERLVISGMHENMRLDMIAAERAAAERARLAREKLAKEAALNAKLAEERECELKDEQATLAEGKRLVEKQAKKEKSSANEELERMKDALDDLAAEKREVQDEALKTLKKEQKSLQTEMKKQLEEGEDQFANQLEEVKNLAEEKLEKERWKTEDERRKASLDLSLQKKEWALHEIRNSLAYIIERKVRFRFSDWLSNFNDNRVHKMASKSAMKLLQNWLDHARNNVTTRSIGNWKVAKATHQLKKSAAYAIHSAMTRMMGESRHVYYRRMVFNFHHAKEDSLEIEMNSRSIAMLASLRKQMTDRWILLLLQDWLKRYRQHIADMILRMEKCKAACKAIMLVLAEIVGRVMKVRFELFVNNYDKAMLKIQQEQVRKKRFQAQVGACQKMKQIYWLQLMTGTVTEWNAQRLEAVAVAVSDLQAQQLRGRINNMKTDFEKTLAQAEADYEELEASHDEQTEVIEILNTELAKKAAQVKVLKAELKTGVRAARDTELSEMEDAVRKANQEVVRANQAVKVLKEKCEKLSAAKAVDRRRIVDLEEQLRSL